MNQGLNIERHAAGVAELRAATDALYAAIETHTEEAEQALIRYQALKRESELALAEAGRDYSEAERLFIKSDILTEKLIELSAEHKRLSKLLNSGAAPELDGKHEERRRLRELGEQIAGMKDEMRRLRNESQTEKNVMKAAMRV